jgi:hypothetical protein
MNQGKRTGRYDFQFMQMESLHLPKSEENARPPSDTTTGASHSTPSPVKPISQYKLLRNFFLNCTLLTFF